MLTLRLDLDWNGLLFVICLLVSLKCCDGEGVVTSDDEEVLVGGEAVVSSGDAIHFEFIDKRLLKYSDPTFGVNEIEVPAFVQQTYSRDRVVQEINYYLSQNPRQFSHQLLLEELYYALTYGQDFEPQPPPFAGCLQGARGWLDAEVEICDWDGVSCYDINPRPQDRPRVELKLASDDQQPSDKPYGWEQVQLDFWPTANIVTRLDLAERSCRGTLPSSLSKFVDLRRLDLRGNLLEGSLPEQLGDLTSLTFLDISYNTYLKGTLPLAFSEMTNLTELWLNNNQISGSLQVGPLRKLKYLDLSHNALTGTLPTEFQQSSLLEGLFLENNKLSGDLIRELAKLKRLKYLNLSGNSLEGSIPRKWFQSLSKLRYLFLESNRITGILPKSLEHMTSLVRLRLGANQMTGIVFGASDYEETDPHSLINWKRLSSLKELSVEDNVMSGLFSPDFCLNMTSLTSLDIGINFFHGTIPSEIAEMKRLERFSCPANDFEGTIPEEMGNMENIKHINLTSNRLTGTVPEAMCRTKEGKSYIDFFGCDAILCPPGTFHPNGAANDLSSCVKCLVSRVDGYLDPQATSLLGRSTCEHKDYPGTESIRGAKMTTRDVLEKLYENTVGKNWGDRFNSWADRGVSSCDLSGVTCDSGDIIKIDLADANLCADATGASTNCKGLPSEIGLLSTLEELHMPRRQFLVTTIPTEIGTLPKLRLLDMSHCSSAYGKIPSEIGNLTNMLVLNLSNNRLGGTIPTELFQLTRLEKLHLSANGGITGTIPSEVGELRVLKELMLSRLALRGTIPSTVGRLASVENVELYGNVISGTLPSELGRCTNLKRLDAFNNQITGSVPEALSTVKALQILHLKKNKLTGTLPSQLGNLQFLSWIDVSVNAITGQIPEEWSNLKALKDLRLGDNRLYGPIPQSLCNHPKVNGGRTREHGCDAILCRYGFHDLTGFAYETHGCSPCIGGTTVYLGSSNCVEMNDADYLVMFYDLMFGDEWALEDRLNWKSETISACDWAGVTCDKEEIVGVSFPMSHAFDPQWARLS